MSTTSEPEETEDEDDEHDIEIEFKRDDGTIVTVYATMCSPDPDVGIMGWWADTLWATDAEGNAVELTDAEDDRASDEVAVAYADSVHGLEP